VNPPPAVDDEWDEEVDGPRNDDWIADAYERQHPIEQEDPWSR
jgi:hypothetical protein